MHAGEAMQRLRYAGPIQCQNSSFPVVLLGRTKLRAASRLQRLTFSKQASRPSRQQRQRCQPCRATLTFSDSSGENGAGLHFGKKRGPIDDRYIVGLLMQQRKHLFLAGIALASMLLALAAQFSADPQHMRI
ncbi:hypothetical protein CVIRNUC_011209 [Coccomyxa viridis]|uniref:Uncharacterized protein n=1 Tax=Coccomyxa viridis TaxID=1274662 RepID=A0AAV1IMP3_9CHLO|nr:hypothetical protein CVIRNUC_011209 [Coccomyxa viridis]